MRVAVVILGTTIRLAKGPRLPTFLLRFLLAKSMQTWLKMERQYDSVFEIETTVSK